MFLFKEFFISFSHHLYTIKWTSYFTHDTKTKIHWTSLRKQITNFHFCWHFPFSFSFLYFFCHRFFSCSFFYFSHNFAEVWELLLVFFFVEAHIFHNLNHQGQRYVVVEQEEQRKKYENNINVFIIPIWCVSIADKFFIFYYRDFIIKLLCIPNYCSKKKCHPEIELYHHSKANLFSCK